MAGILVTGVAIVATIWYAGLAKALRPSQAPRPGLKAAVH